MIRLIDRQQKNNKKEDTFLQVKQWIMQHIHTPIQGFEHKRNPDGRFYSREQQLMATRYQVLNIADYFLSNGKSYEEIITVLRMFRKDC